MKRLVLGAAAVLALVLTAVAGAAQTAKIKPPAAIAKAGKIVWCSDITYPPEEYYEGTKAAGSDIDIATQISKLLGVKAEFKNVTFDGIIAALLAKKCNAIISGMNDTPLRRKAVDFVDYLKVGQSILVKKPNPKHVKTLTDLAGLSVSVETGTTNRDFLIAENKKLQKAGKKQITIKAFPKDTDAASALKAGRVDAYFGDAPVAANYASEDTALEVAGSPIQPFPIGIATRKGDALRAPFQKAVRALYVSGSMKRIVDRWGMTNAVELLRIK